MAGGAVKSLAHTGATAAPGAHLRKHLRAFEKFGDVMTASELQQSTQTRRAATSKPDRSPRKETRSPREETRPPKHLEACEAHLWRRLLEQFAFPDVAARALLAAVCEAHQRMRRCREQIAKDGETITDRFGQTKAHPLLAAERDARAAFISGMRALRLDPEAA